MTSTEKALQSQIEQLTHECDRLRQKCVQSEEAYNLLMYQLKQMLRHRFGQRSERYKDPHDPQGLLFDNSAALDDEPSGDDNEDGNVVSIAGHKRRKKVQKSFADHLPREEVVIPVEEHDKACSCGCRKQVINHERPERLNYVPPVYEVIVELREKVACPKGCEGQMV